MSNSSSTDLGGSEFSSSEPWGEGPPRRQKTGGRKKGTPNKKTVERAKLLAQLKVDGTDPVSFFASILQNDDAPLDLRFQAARELAPYVHPKLSSIEARTGGRTHEDRLEELQRLLEEPLAHEDGG